MAKQTHNRRSSTMISHLGLAPRRRQAPKAAPPPPAPVPAPAAPPPVAPAAVQRQAELENDLQVARDLQQGLMLQTVPRLPGWEISAASLPARELGGDLYDFLPLRADRQGIMIGDVSGKGLPAALRMAVARTVFRAEARRDADPGQTLRAVNRVLIEEMPHGMVTLLYAQVNPLSGQIRFANAGHNYPILIRQQVEEVEVSGLPLGVADMEDYAEEEITLHHGETALFYTDGVVEALSEHDELFGFARLQELLATVGHLKPRALMARILAEVRAWASGQGQDDDITMVLLRRRLARLSDELHSIAADVLGPLTTEDLWAALDLHDQQRSAEEWNEALRALSDHVSGQFGRGIAREILGQLRPVIDEYRLIEATAREAQGDRP